MKMHIVRKYSALVGLPSIAAAILMIAGCGSNSGAPNIFRRVNLVSNVVGFSDSAGTAAVTDPNLKNPWGIAFSPSGPFWIADNGTSLATVYNGTGAVQPLVIAIPGPSGPGAP